MGVGSKPQQASQLKIDVGCGGRKVSSEYLGLDLRKLPGIDIVASAAALPFKNESFAEVYTRRCIQHIKDDEKVISEFHRFLQKDGKATFIFASWTGWFVFKLRLLFRKNPVQFSIYALSKNYHNYSKNTNSK
jgi:ubiquinone/menaquinone biosynthesis C-methylase UbiE